jgi:hypothetical protein
MRKPIKKDLRNLLGKLEIERRILEGHSTASLL